jgi:hypothetical protein
MCLGFGLTFGAVTTISGTEVEGAAGFGAVDGGAEFCCAAAGTATIAIATAVAAAPLAAKLPLVDHYFRTMKK